MARIMIIMSPIQKRLIALFYGLYVGAKMRPNAYSQVYYKPDFESHENIRIFDCCLSSSPRILQ